MKGLFTIAFCLLYLDCFCQIIIGTTPGQANSHDPTKIITTMTTGMNLLPYQKTDFDLHVFNSKHKLVITDDSGKIMHSQQRGKGHFEVITNYENKYLIIYDKVGDKRAVISAQSGDGYNTIISYGKCDAEANIKVELLPRNDTINKHFVRFLCLCNTDVNTPNFSISLDKIPAPSLRTDPYIDLTMCYEDNIIVNSPTYLIFKKYILNYQNKLDKIFIKNILIEINIDYQKRFYMSASQAVNFLTNFISYLKQEKISDQYTNLSLMLEIAKNELKNSSKNINDPN